MVYIALNHGFLVDPDIWNFSLSRTDTNVCLRVTAFVYFFRVTDFARHSKILVFVQKIDPNGSTFLPDFLTNMPDRLYFEVSMIMNGVYKVWFIRWYHVKWWSRSLDQWRHNERDGVSNHRRLDRLLSRLFRCRSKNTSKLRVTGLCEGISPVTGGFTPQRISNAENVSIWWRHHG